MASKRECGPLGMYAHANPNDGTMNLGCSPAQGVLGARRRPVEKAPKYAFLNVAQVRTYRPSGDQIASWHMVVKGKSESFRTIAAQYGVAVDQLIELNFPGSVEDGRIDPAIVNWYLDNHEDFHCPPTEDGHNRRFQGGERLAIPKPTIIQLAPIRLVVGVEELMLYSTDESAFVRMAKNFEEESSKHKAEPVNGPTDIYDILQSYSGLKQINIYTHGSPGHAYFNGRYLHKGNVPVILEANDSLFSGKGRVLFLGCNVGEGPVGRDFLVIVGQTLLKGKGGFVGATTSKNFSDRFGFLDIHKPLWGDLRIIEVDASGNVVQDKSF